MVKQSGILYLPPGFCAACRTFRIDPCEAVRFYICNTTFYSNLLRNDNVTAFLAFKIFMHCLEEKGENYRSLDVEKRKTSIRFVKEVVKTLEGKYSRDEKLIRYKNVISRWYQAINEKLPPGTVITSTGLTISLEEDFCLLSDIFQFNPLTLIQHYVNQVSLAANINQDGDNTLSDATSFFLQFPPVLEKISLN